MSEKQLLSATLFLLFHVHISSDTLLIYCIFRPNGAGKSTLIKMLMEKEKPDAGSIKVGETVNMIGVGQERMEELDPTKTVFEEISNNLDEIELGGSYVNSRAYLSWFGFKSAQQQQKVANLSGGERNRVQLAKLLKAGANVIILDEPTNDLVSLFC